MPVGVALSPVAISTNSSGTPVYRSSMAPVAARGRGAEDDPVMPGGTGLRGLGAEDPVMPDGTGLPPMAVSTNSSGTSVYRFSLVPVLTNAVAASNELARLKTRLTAINVEVKDLLVRENPLKTVMREDYVLMSGYATNYIPQDAEGKKLKERISELDKELKGLQQQLEKKMAEDAGYQKAKRKDDADRKVWQSVQQRKGELIKEKSGFSAQIWQIQTMIDRAQTDVTAKEPASAPAATLQ